MEYATVQIQVEHVIMRDVATGTAVPVPKHLLRMMQGGLLTLELEPDAPPAEDSSKWLTRREACERIAKTLWNSTSKSDVKRAGEMLDRATLRGHVKDNSRKGPEKKIDPTTLGNWLNSQRDRELDADDDDGDEDAIAARIEEARRKIG